MGREVEKLFNHTVLWYGWWCWDGVEGSLLWLALVFSCWVMEFS